MANTNAQRETIEKQRVQDLEQRQLVGYWAKKKYGTNAKILLEHDNWRDVSLMLEYREEFQGNWNQKEHNTWASYWSLVVYKGFPLKGKHLRKLESIAQGILERRQKNHTQRQKIQALRNPYKKRIMI